MCLQMICKQNSFGGITLHSVVKHILKFTTFMQNIENNSPLSPYVQLLWSGLLEQEERIFLLIGLF